MTSGAGDPLLKIGRDILRELGQRQIMVEATGPQKGHDLRDDQRIVHHERVCHGQGDMVGHALQLRALHRDLAVVRPGEEGRQDRVEREAAGDDALAQAEAE